MAPSTRTRNARGSGDLLRGQLVDAAVEVLDAEGDASRVSVRAIARTAGVSPTALYLHFPDRDALVDAAVDQAFEAFNAAIIGSLSEPLGPRRRLGVMGRAYLAFTEQQPALYNVLFTTRRPMARSASAVDTGVPAVERDEALDALVAAVADATPELDGAEQRVIAMKLWAALHGYAMLRACRPLPGWPESDRYVDDLVDAHVPSPPGA